ncbi:MAG: FecR family protein [Terriglobales bacterium]
MSITKLGKILATCAALAAVFLVVSASAESKARIVRLSEVQGTVQLDRAAGDGFDKAFLNLPVVEGSRLKTGKDGRAEVEFEDGSALRLAPDSEIDFGRLALGNDGQKLNIVQLVSGTVYADLRPKTYGKDKVGDQFQLNFAAESVSVSEAAHFRVIFGNANKASLAVFKGKVSAASPTGEFEVAEKHSATINFAKADPKADLKADPKEDLKTDDSAKKDAVVIAKNFKDDPSDEWDRQQSEYHARYAPAGNSSIASPYGYGMSDLNYYGNFMTVPGFGNVWQPYFIGAGWNPFLAGGFAYYPGAGYMYVSGYPWGWMPFNYGAWAMAPGYGWVWQPGNWNSRNAFPVVVNAPVGMVVPTAPVSGHQTVMVGLGLTAFPATGAPSRLTINPNSAGFGVPRGSVDRLDRFAKTMARTSRPVEVSTIQPFSPMQSGRGFGASSGFDANHGAHTPGIAGTQHGSAAPAAASSHH